MTCKKFCSAARCNRVGRVGSSFEGTRKYLKSSLASLSSIISVSRLIYMQVAVQLISLEFIKFKTSIYFKNRPLEFTVMLILMSNFVNLYSVWHLLKLVLNSFLWCEIATNIAASIIFF